MVSIEGFMSSSISFAPSVVLHDLSFISSGVTTSSPYRSLNGENFVVFDSVVLCDQMTLGSCCRHKLTGLIYGRKQDGLKAED